MSFNYTPLQQTVSELIQRYGFEASFTSYTQSAYNPISGTMGSETSEYTAFIVTLMYTTREINNDTILAGDIKAYAEANGYNINDTVEIGNQIYRIVSVNPLQPAENPLYFELQLRR